MNLDSPISFFLYLFLQNRFSWALLSPAAKQAVLDDNSYLNNQRDDYLNPENYGMGRFEKGSGDNWDSPIPRDFRHRGEFLSRVMEKYKPATILEIGPGAGFDSRPLCERSSTRRYVAIDIVEPFLKYLRPRLQDVAARRPGFSFELICGDFKTVPLGEKFDAVFILSAVHHISDRVKLFSRLGEFLKDGGIVVCYEPTHYLRRLLQLFMDYFRKGYFRRDHFKKRGNISTHHFCTYAEFEQICRRTGQFELVHREHETPKKLKAWGLAGGFADHFWLSWQIGVVLRKKSGPCNDAKGPSIA